MVILFGTLGWEPKSLILSIRTRDNVEKVILYHSPDDKSIDAAKKVQEYCKTINLPIECIKLKDQFDLLGIVERLKKDIKKYRSKDIVFNITGGTRVMSNAAILTCILEGIPAVYANEKTGREDMLPLLQVKYRYFLSKKQREILKTIKELGQYCTPSELMAKIGIKKATISHHLTELEKKGLIVLEPSKYDSRKKVVRLVESTSLLLTD